MRLAILAVAAASLGAQSQQDPLAARLDSETYRTVQEVMAAARRDSLPVAALEKKALEGVAKRVPGPRIAAAVRQLADALRVARQTLRSAVPDTPLADGEVVAAAEALRRGAPAEHVAAVRAAAPATTMLEIPLAVLGELVQRGVPVEQARDVIVHMVKSGVPQARMVEVPSRVDVALRVGATPVAALGSALQGLGIPAPPLSPGEVPSRRPGGRPPVP